MFLTTEKKCNTSGGRIGSRFGYLAFGRRGLPDRYPQAQKGLNGYLDFSSLLCGGGGAYILLIRLIGSQAGHKAVNGYRKTE